MRHSSEEKIEDSISRGIDEAFTLGWDKGYVDGLRKAVDILWRLDINTEAEKKWKIKTFLEFCVKDFTKKWGTEP